MKSWFALIPVVMLPLIFGGCSKQPTEMPDISTSVPVEEIGASLSVDAPVVKFRERETDGLQELTADDLLTVQPGANILVEANGRATLAWPGFLTNELLAGADTLLSLSDPGVRNVILDQAAGTARYILDGPGEPADLVVMANWIQIHVTEGEADFIVSFIPGAEPSVWLAVLTGKAEVTRGGDVQNVNAGQAAAFTEQGVPPEILDVDPTAVRAWYDEVAAGTAEGPLATVAFRCVVGATAADYLAAPDVDAESVDDPLPAGTIVNVLQRDDSGDWLHVSPLAAVTSGWVAAGDLACNGPIDNAPSEGPATTIELPTVTATLRPLVTFTPSATFRAVTPTPTVTATPGGDVVIEFWVDKKEIDRGKCTTLHWKVFNIREVYLNGKGELGGERSKEVCPDETTTYTLKVVKRDGTEESRSVKVEVKGTEPSATPKPSPQATQTPFSLPTTPPPPTAAPTTAVPPTAVPPTAVPPTNVPPTATTESPTTEAPHGVP